ncbi:hypothetical protein OMAG_001478, partial [Candidatus Omnitrophus magneticus]
LLFHAAINKWNITRPLFSEFKKQKSAENHNSNFQWLTLWALERNILHNHHGSIFWNVENASKINTI